MTPAEFKQLRLSLGLTQREMAKVMGGINYRTVQRFENGDMPIERMALQLCQYMKKYGVLKDEI
jgi:DNA-binding transcriptional regulator YiaG